MNPINIKILGEIVDMIRPTEGKSKPIIHPITSDRQVEILEYLDQNADRVLGIEHYEYDTTGDNTGLYTISVQSDNANPLLLTGFGRCFVVEIVNDAVKAEVNRLLDMQDMLKDHINKQRIGLFKI